MSCNTPINNINQNWERAMFAKLRNMVSTAPQNLTEEQKAQARENLGISGTATYSEFSSSWPTDTTLQAFCQAIANDESAVVGMAYYGMLDCTGLPEGMQQGDVVVEILGTNDNKVVHLIMSSTEVSPYHWEASYWQNHLYGWFNWATNDTTQGYYTVPTSQITNPQEGDISAPPRDVIFPSLIGTNDLTSYSTKKIMVVPTTATIIAGSPDIVVRFSDNTSQTYDAQTCGTLIFDAGVVSSVEASPYALYYIYAFLPPKIYHNDAWVDIDTMFLALDTVLANAQGYYNVPTSQISSPKEGDLSIVAASEEQLDGLASTIDLTPYSTKYIRVNVTNTSYIYVKLSDNTYASLSSGDNDFAPGEAIEVSSGMGGVMNWASVKAITPASNNVYHNGFWVDLDTLFADPVDTVQPVGGLLPNVLYKLGTLTGNVTITFAAPTNNNIENEYKLTFTADSIAPNITWPNDILEWKGDCIDSVTGAPIITAAKYYQVSVLDGYAVIIEF